MKVLNYGSLNLDYVYEVDHFVRAGETLSSDGLKIFPGGKGLNQSIALCRSGVEVWHAGAVGSSDGAVLLEALGNTGVHTEYIRQTKVRTGHAIIQKDRNGQNCILLYGGANQEITETDIDQAMAGFEEGDFLILQNEINGIAYIMEAAHKRGMKIIFNPSPMNDKIFTYPLKYVDYFLLNEIEAGDICRTTGEGEALLKALAAEFPEAKIVLTLGSDGAFYKDGETVIRQEIYKVDVVDTTAAGDTFTGFFIGGLVLGEAPETALDHAAKASSLAVSRAGAAPSIPWRKEL